MPAGLKSRQPIRQVASECALWQSAIGSALARCRHCSTAIT